MRVLFAARIAAVCLLAAPGWGAALTGKTVFDRYGLPPAPAADKHLQEFEAFRSRARQGGSLRMAHSRPIHIVFPFAMKDGRPIENGPWTEVLYESLMESHPFGSSRTLYAVLAKQYWIDRKEQTLTIETNPEARFWDGEPVTAADVEFSWKAFVQAYGGEKGTKFMRDIYGKVDVQVLSPSTIRFHFLDLPGERMSDAVYYLLAMGIVKPWRQTLSTDVQIPYMGTGGYRIQQITREVMIVRREKPYWASEHPMRKNLFNFDELYAVVYRDDSVARVAFQGQSLNIHYESQVNHEERLITDGRSNGFSRRSLRRWDREISSMGVVFNTQKPHTGRPAFRKALMLALDFEYANQNFFQGRLHRLRAPGDLSLYAPQGDLSLEARALVAQSPVSAPPTIFRNYENYGYRALELNLPERERLKRAQQILLEDGYTVRGTTLTRNGVPVRLEFLMRQPNSSYGKMLPLYRLTLARLGIDLQIREVSDVSSYSNEAKKRQYDMVFSSVPVARGFESLNMNFVRQALHSTNAGNKDHIVNLANLESPFLDWVIDELAVTAPASGRFRPLAELFLRTLSDEMPFGLIGEKTENILFADDRICTSKWNVDVTTTAYEAAAAGCDFAQ